MGDSDEDVIEEEKDRRKQREGEMWTFYIAGFEHGGGAMSQGTADGL